MAKLKPTTHEVVLYALLALVAKACGVMDAFTGRAIETLAAWFPWP